MNRVYCGPPTAPVECVERLVEIVKADGPQGLASLEASGHAAAVWAYVADRLSRDGRIVGMTADDADLAASVQILAKEYCKEADACGALIPGFLIDIIVSQVLTIIVEKLQDPEFWDRALAFIEDLLKRR